MRVLLFPDLELWGLLILSCENVEVTTVENFTVPLDKAIIHVYPMPPPSALGVCRTAAGRGQDEEQTPVCSPGEALTAALTRGLTLRFV